MRSPILLARTAAIVWLASATGAQAQALTYADLIGWWRSDLAHNGQHAEMYIRFAEEGGKPVVRVTLPPIHGWDFPFGSAKVSGNRVQFNAVPLALEFDPTAGTLTGELPPDFSPAHRIAVSFRKTDEPQRWTLEEWPAIAPALVWTAQADGAVWAGLAHDAASRHVFVASDTGTVMALDARNGTRAWSFATADKVRAQPVVDRGFVYVNSDDGYLYKLDVRSGKEAWRAAIDSRSAPRPKRQAFDRYGSSALVDGKRLYVGSADGNLYALDTANGRELWRAASKGKVYASPIRYDDAIVFGSFDGFLYSVAASDGRARWQTDTRGAIATAPAITGKRVVVGNRAFELSGLNADTGTAEWRHFLFFSWVDSVPTIANGTVYVGSSDTGSVLAFEVATGKPEWQSALGGWCWPQVAVTRDRVYAGVSAAKGTFNVSRGGLVALDRKTGKVI
jgi:eukaryotic-like serine/threonine-protein kinase